MRSGLGALPATMPRRQLRSSYDVKPAKRGNQETAQCMYRSGLEHSETIIRKHAKNEVYGYL